MSYEPNLKTWPACMHTLVYNFSPKTFCCFRRDVSTLGVKRMITIYGLPSISFSFLFIILSAKNNKYSIGKRNYSVCRKLREFSFPLFTN